MEELTRQVMKADLRAKEGERLMVEYRALKRGTAHPTSVPTGAMRVLEAQNDGN